MSIRSEVKSRWVLEDQGLFAPARRWKELIIVRKLADNSRTFSGYLESKNHICSLFKNWFLSADAFYIMPSSAGDATESSLQPTSFKLVPKEIDALDHEVRERSFLDTHFDECCDFTPDGWLLAFHECSFTCFVSRMSIIWKIYVWE